MKYLLIPLIVLTLPAYGQKTFQASFGVHQLHQYYVETDLCRYHYLSRKEGEVIWSNVIRL